MSADEGFATALTPGTEVHGYRIRSVLGAGGFGITYLAEHVAIGNQVALKEFLPGGIAARSKDGNTVRPASPAQQDDYSWGLARFREEARTLGRLKHPAIVPVLNFFEANGTAYCAMEYIGGETLDAVLRARGKLGADELKRSLPPQLAGIEAVHGAGFLHRDIKPANILLREDGSPILIDFGAARQALGAHSRSLTAILSEGYAPYEQYQRDGDQGPWTDIYALGATLYRCVTGERPTEATRRVEARIKAKPDPLRPAAEAAAGRYPPAVLGAIDRALGVMETERPQNIAALRALLTAPDSAPALDAAARHAAPGATLVAGGPPAAAPASNADAASRAARRRRWAWAGVAALLVVGAGVADSVLLSGERAKAREARLAAEREAAAERERKAQEEARQKAEEEARKRREAAEAEERRQAEERRKAEEEQRKRREVEEAETKRAQAAKDQAEADRRNGYEAAQRKEYDEAIRLLTRAISSRALSGWALAQAHNHRGLALRGKNDNDRAIEDFSAAIRIEPPYGPAWGNRAETYRRRKEFARALSDVNEAIRLLPRAHQGYFIRAQIWEDQRDFARAISDFTKVIELNPGPSAHYFRGSAWEKSGDRDKAIADYRAALARDGNYELAIGALRRLGVPR